MADIQPTPTPSRALERHIQSFIQGGCLILLCWLIYTVHQGEVRDAAMQSTLEQMQPQIANLIPAVADRYTAERASADFAARDRTIADLQERVRSLEEEARRDQP